MFIDFKEIKKSVSFEDVIKLLELKLSIEDNQHRGACPCGKGGERALVITPSKGWYCFGSKEGGDVIALTAHIKRIGVKDAGAYLAERLLTKEDKPEPSGTLAPLTYLDPKHDEVASRGFTEDIATKVGIGYANKGMMKGLVCFPVRLPDGTLIGYAGIIGGVKTPKQWRIP